MAHIRSRKHAAAPQPAHTALALAALTMPMTLLAQQAAPAAAGAEATLPEVKARAAAETPYKADAVASPKFTQPLVDTPQTITVIKKEILQQQAATSLTEALRNTPGITMQLGENGNTTTGDSIFMRGFDTTNSIFVDGIRDLGNISRDVFNIEQVEVVKGPSGSDNGRGASSGYVNLVSKTAAREAFGNASIALGDASRVRATVDLNRPLDIALPGSAVRLNVMAQDFGVPGRDEVKAKRWGFAPSLAIGLGTPTRTYLNYLYIDQKNRPDGGVSTFGLPAYNFGANTPGAAVDPKNYYGSRSDFDDVTLHMFTARIEHDFGRGTVLRNTTRLGHTEQDFVLTGVNAVTATAADPASWTVARSRQARHQTNEILTNQTNLNTEFATGGVSHSLSTGFELIHERQNQVNAQTLTNTTLPASLQQAVANLYRPNIDDAFLMPPFKGAYAKGSTLSAAVYAFDTLKLSDAWLLNAGLRWEKFHTETNGATFTAATATLPESLVQNAPLSLTDNLLSWKLGAVFKPTADGSVYVTVSNAYQPPGGANHALSTSATNQASPSLEPQEGSNLEVGTKWDLLGGRLAATAAVYRSENRNELVSDGATPASFSQVGRRRIDGVELALVGQLTPAFNLSAGLAYMDPKIVRGVPGATGNQGGAIVYSPKVTFSSWATYKLAFGMTLGGGVRYVDPVVRNSNLNNATSANLPGTESYTVADAMLAYEVTKNVNLQLNVYNLFDRQYVAAVNNGGSRYVPGQPRNVLLTANVAF
ncbi:catecholate siderophore receptor Fiu [Piscinibacter sp. XHJ-5]|uniref:catecholate siderophore receptor Fiu n=1 Tax=Piscinibacter sp. XHJ-5 TaxID=3037797 RepID=UPI002452C671|nr:catecholate siderophore receptor Fiu [Piscinibacter sp. XHJ-5]